MSIGFQVRQRVRIVAPPLVEAAMAAPMLLNLPVGVGPLALNRSHLYTLPI